MVLANFWKKLSGVGSKNDRRHGHVAVNKFAQIESFESRCFLSISSVFNAGTGELSITSNGRDAMTVGANANGEVTLNGRVLATGVSSVLASDVKSLSVKGGSGNNRIDLSGVNATAFPTLTSVSINGGSGNDTIHGSDLADNIVGGNGNDIANGLGGNDSISGGNGIDVLSGGEGNDNLTGGEGNDSLDGGAGHDAANGGNGKDTITGGSGDDALDGGSANDRITGDDGQDTINGGSGNDVVDGNAGHDELHGGANNDTLNGGEGDDAIDGGANNDVANGGAGNDRIAGNFGNDALNGGDGNDSIRGDSGNDSITGGDGNDHLQAGAGTDKAQGNAGDDTIFGGTGADNLDTGTGTDIAVGGDGADTITSDGGDTVIADGSNGDTGAPVANHDNSTVAEGGSVLIDVRANDSDGGLPTSSLTVNQASSPAHGSVTLNADGTFTYQHDGSENFSDSFTYKLNDGLSDSNVATVSITITPVNDQTPVANDDAVTVDAGVTATIHVRGNDTDDDLPVETLTVIKVGDPTHGTLTVNPDGSLTYVHDGSADSSDSFTYKLNDGLNDSNVATVSITVTPIPV